MKFELFFNKFRVYFARCLRSSRSLLYSNVHIGYYTIHITVDTMVNFVLVLRSVLMCIILKVSIEFVTTRLLLSVLAF